MKAFLHVHTAFSYDGEISLERVIDGARALGAGAVFINEHLRGMSQVAYRELVRRARGLSGENMTVIPGLEVGIPGGGDILAIGLEEIPASKSTCSLADEIHEQGGVAILAHAERARHISPSAFRKLDGIEVWNGLHDSKYFPSGASLSLLKGGRTHNRSLFGCCGLDLHARSGWFPLYLQLGARAGGDPLAALKSGAFTYGRRNLMYDAEWVPNVWTLAALTALTFAYKALALGLSATGISFPRSLSRAMRRRLNHP